MLGTWRPCAVPQLINKAQHGFLHGRSCVTQLLTTLHHVGQLLDNNVQTDIIFLDFAKAFDSVDHIILLKKLKSYGISGNMYNWFTDYLHGRKQRVMVVQYCQTYTDREHGKILTYGSYGPYELKMASRIVRTVRFVKRIYGS